MASLLPFTVLLFCIVRLTSSMDPQYGDTDILAEDIDEDTSLLDATPVRKFRKPQGRRFIAYDGLRNKQNNYGHTGIKYDSIYGIDYYPTPIKSKNYESAYRHYGSNYRNLGINYRTYNTNYEPYDINMSPNRDYGSRYVHRYAYNRPRYSSEYPNYSSNDYPSSYTPSSYTPSSYSPSSYSLSSYTPSDPSSYHSSYNPSYEYD